MSFWRKEVIDAALDAETVAHIAEQKEWIAREPRNPQPWYNLARLYRMQWKADEALGLLLQAVALQDSFPPAHLALAEIYAIREDYPAAWKHARKAEQCGDAAACEMLRRHGVPEP
ncbi:MAG: hypothetical protein U0Q18_28990 [Bryobacteraceae bacterium]